MSALPSRGVAAHTNIDSTARPGISNQCQQYVLQSPSEHSRQPRVQQAIVQKHLHASKASRSDSSTIYNAQPLRHSSDAHVQANEDAQHCQDEGWNLESAERFRMNDRQCGRKIEGTPLCAITEHSSKATLNTTTSAQTFQQRITPRQLSAVHDELHSEERCIASVDRRNCFSLDENVLHMLHQPLQERSRVDSAG